jgi:hypothetical protein
MERGLYVTFFSKDEPATRQLPPVGPLDNVVLRQHALFAERRSVQQAQELGVAIDRWLEAELEMQRAIGDEPGGTKRSEKRFSASDGVYLRFAAFGNPSERDTVPELGPFAVVVVGPRSVEADGATLATRAASELAPWELAAGVGDEHIGLHKPDLAFRTAHTSYHPSIAPATPRAGAATVVADSPEEPSLPEGALPAEEPLLPDDPPFIPDEPLFEERPRQPAETYSVRDSGRDDTLRTRMDSEERKRLGVDGTVAAGAASWPARYGPRPSEETADGDGAPSREWAPALWRMRFAIIGALLVLVAVYGFVALRSVSLTVGGPGQLQYVGVAQRFGSDHWEYVVNSVTRTAIAGTPQARASYFVVRVAATRRLADGPDLSPADFSVIDGNGVTYAPEALSSPAYESGSAFTWPTAFPVGRPASMMVVFDLGQSPPRGLLLVIDDLPNMRVRLD